MSRLKCFSKEGLPIAQINLYEKVVVDKSVLHDAQTAGHEARRESEAKGTPIPEPGYAEGYQQAIQDMLWAIRGLPVPPCSPYWPRPTADQEAAPDPLTAAELTKCSTGGGN